MLYKRSVMYVYANVNINAPHFYSLKNSVGDIAFEVIAQFSVPLLRSPLTQGEGEWFTEQLG